MHFSNEDSTVDSPQILYKETCFITVEGDDDREFKEIVLCLISRIMHASEPHSVKLNVIILCFGPNLK